MGRHSQPEADLSFRDFIASKQTEVCHVAHVSENLGGDL